MKSGILKFEKRVKHMEGSARKAKQSIEKLSSDELMLLWKEAKKREKGKRK